VRGRLALGVAVVCAASALAQDVEHLREGTSRPAPLAETGAPVDREAFAYSRALVRPKPDAAGLFVVALDAHVLAHSRGRQGRFSDLRLVDDEGRQVPYVREQDLEPMRLDLTLAPRTDTPRGRVVTPGRESLYGVTLPYPGLPGMRLELETPARVFDRRVVVTAEREADRRRHDVWFEVLAEVRWSHADPDTPAPPLVVPLRELDTTELLITIVEGDNRPLEIGASRLQLPAHRLRFRHPDGASLRLYYGHPDLATPSYDLALRRDELLEGEAEELSLGDVEGPTAGDDGAGLPRWMFWTVLAVTVLALLALIARLLRTN
jgi:hypothetical protein